MQLNIYFSLKWSIYIFIYLLSINISNMDNTNSQTFVSFEWLTPLNSHILWLTFSFDFDRSSQIGFKLRQDGVKSWGCKFDSNCDLKVDNVLAWT